MEVDTSAYAIPRLDTVRQWLAQTPTGFLFHFKALGLLCGNQTQTAQVPGVVREHVDWDRMKLRRLVNLRDLTPEAIDACWERMQGVFEVAHRRGACGAILFQFNRNFRPSESNAAYVVECRRRLLPQYRMAVVFRDRSWFSERDIPEGARSEDGTPLWGAGSSPLASTLKLLRGLDRVALVGVDELLHELQGRELGLEQRRVLAPVLHVTTPEFAYARAHRRVGTKRLWAREEVEAWAARLERLVSTGTASERGSIAAQIALSGKAGGPMRLDGPVYLMVGTDWEDQPFVNMRALTAKLPDALRYDWVRALSKAGGPKPQASMRAFFSQSRGPTSPASSGPSAAGGAGAGDSGGGARSGAPAASAAAPSPLLAAFAGTGAVRRPRDAAPARAATSAPAGSPPAKRARTPTKAKVGSKGTLTSFFGRPA